MVAMTDQKPGSGGAGSSIGGLQRSSAVEGIQDKVPERIVSGAKTALTAYGQATSRFRPLPDFLVIGTKKGGTTSMMSWLIDHPHVMRMFPRFQRRKSPHYFDINYARGEAWYRAHFPTRAARSLHARRTGVHPLVGEASPYYMFHPTAARRIHETIPDAKLIALLREPGSRAYSNYWDRVATGNEDLPTFEAALDAEAERLSSVSDESLRAPDAYSFDHDHHSYLARGRYAEQLRPIFDIVGRERVLVLAADGMFKDAQGTFDRVQDFLGLPAEPVPLRARNERSEKYPPIAPTTRERLTSYYAPHNRDLFELLGQDFGWL